MTISYNQRPLIRRAGSSLVVLGLCFALLAGSHAARADEEPQPEQSQSEVQPAYHAERDHEVSKRAGQAVHVVLVARGDINRLVTVLHSLGLQTEPVPIVHGVAAYLNPDQLGRLENDQTVRRVIYDAPVTLADSPFNPALLATSYPVLLNAAPAWINPAGPVTGKGVTVAVVDSGISSHPDINHRVILNLNFNPWVNSASDVYGHGTAMAGIIGGNGSASAGRYVGIAPQASLINLRVNDGTGAAPTSAIVNAIVWAVDNRERYNIRVISLSMQSSVAESYRVSLLDAAVEYAWLKGIVVVASAGNGGPNSALYAPANDPYVITVGATGDQPARASFSSFGITQDGYLKPELVAPGTHIVCPLAAGSNIAASYPARIVDRYYVQLSGTSVAAPQVAGVAALYLQAHPGVRPGQLKSVLISTARSLSQPGTGAGFPDAMRAIAYAGPVGNTDLGLEPNNFLKVLYLEKLAEEGRGYPTLPSVSWSSVSWSSVSWSSVSWSSVSWSSVSWSSAAWDDLAWNSVSWNK
jgi:serine protease AprX